MNSGAAAGITAIFLYLSLLIAGIYGWVVNLIAVIGADFGHVTGLLIVRCIGIVVGPLGALIGWFF